MLCLRIATSLLLSALVGIVAGCDGGLTGGVDVPIGSPDITIEQGDVFVQLDQTQNNDQAVNVDQEEQTDVEQGQGTTRDGDQIAICHIPSGNPGNAHTIWISESALLAHLRHGDTLGPCPEDCDDYDPCTVDDVDHDAGECIYTAVICDDDGLFCNGVEVCANGMCISSGNPCSADEYCDEEADECGNEPTDYPPGNPEAYWSFDEGSGTIAHDYSGNGHDLELMQGASWSPGLRGLGALDTRFGYAVAPHADELNLSGSYTVTVWAYQDLLSTVYSGPIAGMHYCYGDNDGSWELYFQPQGETDVHLDAFLSNEYHIYGSSGAYEYNVPMLSWGDVGYGVVMSHAEEWTHLAVTYDAHTEIASVYVNGDLVRQGAWPNPEIGGSMAEFVVGTDHLQPDGSLCGSHHFFEGDIDELAIYSEALTEEQIATLASVPASDD